MGCMSASETKSTSDTKTAAQRSAIDKVLAEYLPTLGQGANIYPEERVTPFTDLQQSAITGAGNFADYFSTPETAGTPLFAETGQATKGILSGETGASPFGSQDVENYFKGAVYDPTMKNLRQDVIPGIAESYAGPGFFGSARSHEESEAYKDTADYLSTQRAGLEWDTEMYNKGLAESKASRTLAAIPQAMAYGQVPAQEIKNNLEIAASKLGGLGAVFGFGQAEQTQAQAELQDEIIRFAQENQKTDPENLEILLTLLNMNYSNSSGTSSGAGLGYQAVSSFLGGAGAGIGQNVGANFFAPAAAAAAGA